MDDEAQDQFRTDLPDGAPEEEDRGAPAESSPSERGANWERRLAQARAEREKILASTGHPNGPPLLRRPFDASGPTPDTSHRSDGPAARDPLVGRPKPWEMPGAVPAARSVGRRDPEPARAGDAAAPLLLTRPASVPPIPAPETGTGHARAAAAPLPAAGGRPPLSKRLTSTGAVAGGVLLGLAAGLVGGLALDIYADPNVASATATRPEAAAGPPAEADSDVRAASAATGEVETSAPATMEQVGVEPAGGGTVGSVAAEPSPADAPQPRTFGSPPALIPVSAPAGTDPALGRAGRAEPAAQSPRSALVVASPAAPDGLPQVSLRPAELSPKLFFGDADRIGSEPVAPSSQGESPRMPAGVAAYISPRGISVMQPFDAADAPPWPATSPAAMPARIAEPFAPFPAAPDAGTAFPAPGTEVAALSAPSPLEQGSADDPAATAGSALPAVPAPEAPLEIAFGPASTETDAPSAGTAGTISIPPPAEAAAILSTADSVPALLDATPPLAGDAGGRPDIRLVGGSAQDRDLLAALGIESAATAEESFPATRREVRFFHAADAALAGNVARQLGADLRDFSSFRPVPPEGRIEVRLPPSE